MEKKSLRPLELFYCYARKDAALRDGLNIHLANLRHQGLVTTWYDGEIIPGTPWEQEIKVHLDTAHIVLLLVSPDFIHSEYCYSTEMIRAIERHSRKEARVIPILLRPADWTGTPFSVLQVLPSNALPVTRWSDRDEAFDNIVQGIRRAITDLFSQQISTLPLPAIEGSSRKEVIPETQMEKMIRDLQDEDIEKELAKSRAAGVSHSEIILLEQKLKCTRADLKATEAAKRIYGLDVTIDALRS